MKRYLSGLFTGIALTTLVGSLVIGASAISSKMTIEVSPINIQVNGQTFAPTDVNGKEVPVFAYEGTTYAPLRALAEAYGLQVGYDQAANMATVQDPDVLPDTTSKVDVPDDGDEKDDGTQSFSYEEFKGLWRVVPDGTLSALFLAVDDSKVQYWFDNTPDGLFEQFCADLAREHEVSEYGDFMNYNMTKRFYLYCAE